VTQLFSILSDFAFLSKSASAGSMNNMVTSSNPVHSTERHFRPGQFLFREGEVSSCLFLIKSGSVAIRKMKGGAYIELGRLYSNEVLGELSFFDRLPRSAAAVALTEVEVLEIPFASLDQIYTKVPDYLKTIISSVANRLRRANEVIRTLQKNVVAEDGGEIPSTAGKISATAALAMANQSLGEAHVEIPSDIPLGSLDTSKAGSEHEDK
jgi:CRP/FNR family transcriptional regulator, cyclic AMP receptor protein